ncbi:MAG TPA: hypothetical protein VM285_03575, partial [Polyangia bacterium]|nr:hypothetical protein [Polyangia bacterium]
SAQQLRGPARASAPAADATVAGKGGGKRLLTGFGDPLFYSSDDAGRGFALEKAESVGVDVVRLFAGWRSIAPQNPSPDFQATNPASPEYNWAYLDTAVREAAARGFRILLVVAEAPDWAEGEDRPASVIPGTWKPDSRDLADFGTAIAKRYSGSFSSLPVVHDYLAWNEPNLESNLTPVWNGTKPKAPGLYVKMLNRFYGAVKAVDRRNRVITGGTAPYGADPGVLNMRPLYFWKKVMCVKGSGKAKRNCKNKARFDVLAHHPINTSGGPRRSAIDPDDVSTPDLRNLVKVLRTAEKANNVKGKGKHPVWATELWWESNPPDSTGVLLKRQADYYAEAMYILWKQGASLILPYQVRDETFTGGPGRTSFQTGAYFIDGSAKPSAQAIRFPFVADRKSKRKVVLWGRAPLSGKVIVEQKKGKGFAKVKKLKAKAGQVFQTKTKLKGSKKLRARIGGESSLIWKLDKK